jgi:hypothetical protein
MKWLGLALLYVGLPLLLAEITEIAPWLAAKLLKVAARALPSAHRERYELEWLGELDAVPGKLLKLLLAIRIAMRVPATRRELERSERAWVVLGRWLLAALITGALGVARIASRALNRLSARPSSERGKPNDRSYNWPADELPTPESWDADDRSYIWPADETVTPMIWTSMGTAPVDTPIEELDLSAKTYRSLKRAGVSSIEDLIPMTDPTRQLLRIRNFGRSSLEELKEKLGEIGWDHPSWD